MASLVLAVAGSAIGSSLGSFTLLGVTMSGAQLGATIGTAVGGIVDNWLFAPTTKQTGPRLTDLNIQTSTEGAAIPRIDGYMRVAGQIIWATKFKETSSTSSSGGKGMGGGVQTTTYSYSISFAVGLCAGIVHRMGRIWADGNLIDGSKYTLRFYQGTETQNADPLIQEIEGAGNTPAYRGLCYVVIEDMDLTAFGNRIPQLQFELVRSITADRPDALENVLVGVNLIPGAGEFVYATNIVSIDNGQGTTASQNKNNSDGIADVLSSLDDLEALAPNLKTVSVVAGWFGDDLRAGNITIKPGVEIAVKPTYPANWSVNGVQRVNARLVSQIAGRPAYGGTPSDDSVVKVIQELKSRGWRVVFYPFVFMDIAAGNALPSPYSANAGTAGQPTYPWRGRITCSPAPGYTGTVDQTSAAATQVNAFFGSATSANYSVSGTTVTWTGGSDWGYRRMVLHYAKLCVAAGGVDSFIIASELRGLTRTRSANTTYPAVTALKTLAADVKAIVGSGCKVGYAADWSEYNNHQTGDVAGAVQFNLDPLWSDANIDFIGIDNYMPLADWRDGTAHLDYNAVTGPTSPHDRAYLQRNIKGGEDYDWYYTSQANRDTQTRTAITDATYGKAWVWRAKDIWNWWANFHYDRANGTESGSHTAWVPQSKPIRFTEIGCPAVDKGANEPNVFYDPKSSESFLPYYSNGARDDLAQRAFLEAHLNYWIVAANNPTSGVYSGSMVDTTTIAAWCWDARPFPFFPQRSDLWGDAPNYDLGHWLNGRLGAVLLSDLVAEICSGAGFAAYDVSNLSGLVTGYARTGTMSPRDELNPLMSAFFFDGVESQGVIKFLMRGQPQTTAVGESDLVTDPQSDPNYSFTLTRAQDDDLPLASRITFIDAGNGYQQGTYQSKRLVGNSNRVQESQLPLVMDRAQAGGVGDRLIQEAWIMRETAAFSLAPKFLALDPADELMITLGSRSRRMRISEVNDTTDRAISAVATDPSIYENFTGPAREGNPGTVASDTGRALVAFMDMPTLTDTDFARAWAPHVAAYADPWPGQVLMLKSATDSNYALDTAISRPTSIGKTMYDFYSGPCWRWDRGNSLYVQLASGSLTSTDDLTVLAGANAIAVQNQDGEWEIIQFRDAQLIGSMQYKLSNLLRGQMGTEAQMRDPVVAGAQVVVLDSSVALLGLTTSDALSPYNWLWGPQGKALSDPAYQKLAITFKSVGQRPYAPARVTGRIVSGDIVLSWSRRDRAPSSMNWDTGEIPMSEQSESYETDIMSGSAVKRTIASATPLITYTAAMQTADFGGPVTSSLNVRVYQLSARTGRGTAKPATIFF